MRMYICIYVYVYIYIYVYVHIYTWILVTHEVGTPISPLISFSSS